MAHLALTPRPITLAALDLAPRAVWLMLIGVVLLAAAWAAPRPELAIVLIVPAMVFVILAVLVLVQARKGGRGAFRLGAPLILHEGAEHVGDKESYRREVSAILRAGAHLPLW